MLNKFYSTSFFDEVIDTQKFWKVFSLHLLSTCQFGSMFTLRSSRNCNKIDNCSETTFKTNSITPIIIERNVMQLSLYITIALQIELHTVSTILEYQNKLYDCMKEVVWFSATHLVIRNVLKKVEELDK